MVIVELLLHRTAGAKFQPLRPSNPHPLTRPSLTAFMKYCSTQGLEVDSVVRSSLKKVFNMLGFFLKISAEKWSEWVGKAD